VGQVSDLPGRAREAERAVKNMVSRGFGGPQQISIIPALKPDPCAVHDVLQ
jgi:hypothetical protein